MSIIMYDKTMLILWIIIVLGLVGFLLPLADRRPSAKILKPQHTPQQSRGKRGRRVQDDGGEEQDDEDGTEIVYVDKSELRIKQVQDYLKEKSEITNDEYQKLTGVSDAQATRDLDKLEKQGTVEQIGKTGAGVVYRVKK